MAKRAASLLDAALFVATGGTVAQRRTTASAFRARELLAVLRQRCELRGDGCECGMHALRAGGGARA